VALWLRFVLAEYGQARFQTAAMWGESTFLCSIKDAISAVEFVDAAPKLKIRVLPKRLFWLLVSEDLVFPDLVGKAAAFRIAQIQRFIGEILGDDEVGQ
jgi:hypothetical protein